MLMLMLMLLFHAPRDKVGRYVGNPLFSTNRSVMVYPGAKKSGGRIKYLF